MEYPSNLATNKPVPSKCLHDNGPPAPLVDLAGVSAWPGVCHVYIRAG